MQLLGGGLVTAARASISTSRPSLPRRIFPGPWMSCLLENVLKRTNSTIRISAYSTVPHPTQHYYTASGDILQRPTTHHKSTWVAHPSYFPLRSTVQISTDNSAPVVTKLVFHSSSEGFLVKVNRDNVILPVDLRNFTIINRH